MKILNLKILILIAGPLFTSLSMAAEFHGLPKSMVVITSNSRPLVNEEQTLSLLQRHGVQLGLHNLDDVSAFEKQLSEGLPNSMEAAEAVVKARITRIGKETFNEKLMKAYAGIATAMRYRIDRYPAIIFDESLVIFGLTDLKTALKTYQQYREKGKVYE